jgi:hypothetical protein
MSQLDALPRRLRWAVFLPAGIVAAVIVDTVLANVFYALGLRTVGAGTEGVTKAVLQSFAFGLTLTFVAAVLSPRPWIVGLVMFALGLLFRIAPVVSMMMVPYQRERLPSLAGAFTAIVIAHALGGALGLYLVRELVTQHSKGSAA